VPTRPLERLRVTVVEEELGGDGGIVGGILAEPVRVEDGGRVSAHLLVQARLRAGDPGREPDLMACVEGARSRREQDARRRSERRRLA
jgi:hypothetical protein